MTHHSVRLRRGYNKLRALASALPRSHSQANCIRPYTLGLVSSSSDRLDFSDVSDDDADSIMGKSNKFDYTNRANSGPKLGHIIGSAIEKEADKVRKDATRHAQKARKVSSSSSTVSGVGSFDSRESVVHHLDIKIPHKQLGDEGVCAMADGLEAALRKGTSDAYVLLEDLNLSDNGITTMSLARLAPIIMLAKHDLKTMDLSNNSIKVETTDEAEQWDAFLRAFKGCLKLRRLDLSGNTRLGAKALEILARTHIGEEPIDPMPATGECSVHSLTAELDCTDLEVLPTSTFDGPMSKGTYLKCRRGLRSIPYLTLNDIGLTDAGALWLSYVVEDHHYPSQLIDELNATTADSTIKIYQQSATSFGIDWADSEPGLSRDGKQLLERAEKFRQQAMLSDQATVASLELVDASAADSDIEGARIAGRRSPDHRHPRAMRGDRRASIRSIRTDDGGEHELSELESARKKIQRSVIEKDGASSAELWRAAMHVTFTARTLSGLGPDQGNAARYYTGPPLFDFSGTRPDGKKKQAVKPEMSRQLGRRNRKKSADSGVFTLGVPHHQGTYAATLTADTSAMAGEQEVAITEVTNSPVIPKKIFKPHRKGAFSDGGDLLAQKTEALALAENKPQRFVQWQKDHIANSTHSFRNPALPSNLPVSLILRIARMTLTKREADVLSRKQVREAVAWGVKRTNMATHREWRKMADSSQVWTLLQSIGCLAYQ